MRIRTGTRAAVAALLLTLVPAGAAAGTEAPAPAAPTTPTTGEVTSDPGPTEQPTADHGPVEEQTAEEALAAAEELFEPQPVAPAPSDGVRARRTTAAAPPEAHASQVLRDLTLRLADLDAPDRASAERLLARPTSGGQDPWPGVKYGNVRTDNTCAQPGAESLRVCMHWVTDPGNVNAPPLAGRGAVPTWVRTNQQVFEQVWDTVVDDLGYKPPRSDAATTDRGVDGRTDVYLAELGVPYGIYGYCVPDRSGGVRARMPAYCVIDNDFAEYSADRLGDLRVTAAHEFFHVVQYSYHARADVWLSESTAAWVEDEVYDTVNDNLQYLWHSPLSRPGSPVDEVLANESPYGSWIWWRFLAESLGRGTASDASVVRDVWTRVGRGQGSLPAVQTVLAQRGRSFGVLFAQFGAVNRLPQQWYAEGASYTGFVSPVRPRMRFPLTAAAPTVTSGVRLLHLSHDHAAFRPGRTLRGTWRLRVQVDLPPTLRGSQATVTVHRRSGAVQRRAVALDARGDGRIVLPFSPRAVDQVVLSLTNASTRMVQCGYQLQTSPYACGGWSRDDGLPFLFRATAVR